MITLKHATSGVLKECPTGFSFTTLFFGFFVPLLLEELNISAGSGIAIPMAFGFYYNEQFIKDALEKGYVPADEASHDWLVNKKIITPESPMGA